MYVCRLILTQQGVESARAVKRYAEADARQQSVLNTARGLPWNPRQGVVKTVTARLQDETEVREIERGTADDEDPGARATDTECVEQEGPRS